MNIIEFIRRNPQLDWDYHLLSNNKNITLDIINDNPNKNWDWANITKIHLNVDNFTKYSNIKWDSRIYLSDDIMSFININPDLNWNWKTLSQINIITMEFIEKYNDKQWNWHDLTYNKNITLEFIDKHIDKPWDVRVISKRYLPSIIYSVK
jgi:hypothetical protein